MQAVNNGHGQWVKSLLSEGANVNYSARTWDAMLITAYENGWKKCVCVLTEAGTDFNRSNNLGVTPLCRAAVFANEEYIELLIQAGTDVNVAKKSPIISALNKIPILNLLLKQKGNVPTYSEVFYKKIQFEGKGGWFDETKSEVQKNSIFCT